MRRQQLGCSTSDAVDALVATKMKSGETIFGQELEVFRKEKETAQQYFFAYLAIRDLAAREEAILHFMNDTPLFWITAHHALLLGAFVALGRVFDQNSHHNVDRLLKVASERV
jgi:hypothetical protein